MDVYRQGSAAVVAVERARLSRLPSSQTTRTGADSGPTQAGGSRGDCDHGTRTIRPLNGHSPTTKTTCSGSQRFLLIFIVLSQLCVRPVPVSADNTYTPNVATTYRLQARCSQKQVQVISNKVSANARRQTEFTRIRVESLATPGNGTYYVRLQSEKYKTYICFNKNGGLRVMEYRANRRCQFTVRQDKDMYTRYQLATHERWYIGFRKNGHPIRGTKRHRRTKCYQFLPIKVQPDRQGPMGSMSEGQRWKMLLDLQAHSRGRSTRRGGVHRRRTGSRTQRPDQT